MFFSHCGPPDLGMFRSLRRRSAGKRGGELALKLSALKIRSLKETGRYSDGDRLFLDPKAPGRGHWMIRVQFGGKRREIGLGSLEHVGLADARADAGGIRRQVRCGPDLVAMLKKEQMTVSTFKDAAQPVQHSLTRRICTSTSPGCGATMVTRSMAISWLGLSVGWGYQLVGVSLRAVKRIGNRFRPETKLASTHAGGPANSMSSVRSSSSLNRMRISSLASMLPRHRWGP